MDHHRVIQFSYEINTGKRENTVTHRLCCLFYCSIYSLCCFEYYINVYTVSRHRTNARRADQLRQLLVYGNGGNGHEGVSYYI